MEKHLHLKIGGMTCVNCQNKIEQGLMARQGVLAASVSYAKGTAEIKYDESEISRQEIIRVIEDLDYEILQSGQAQAPDSVTVISYLVMIVALYILLQSTGVSS